MRTVLKHIVFTSANDRSCLMHIKVTVKRHWSLDPSFISARQDFKRPNPAVSSEAKCFFKSASNNEKSHGSFLGSNEASKLGLSLAGATSSPGWESLETVAAALEPAASSQQTGNNVAADNTEYEDPYGVSNVTPLQEVSIEEVPHTAVLNANQLSDSELPFNYGEMNSADEEYGSSVFNSKGVDNMGKTEWEFEERSLSASIPSDQASSHCDSGRLDGDVSQDFYLDIYNKAQEPATRLHRTVVAPEYKRLDMSHVRSNLKLIKARLHPQQLLNEKFRMIDLGINSLSQLVRLHAVNKYRDYLNSGRDPASPGEGDPSNADKPASPPPPPVYPELLTFQLRVKKEFSHLRWQEYVESQKLALANPKQMCSYKYCPEHIDAWTKSVKVVVKNQAYFEDIMRPAFSRLGLDYRADFRFTIGCFIGDRRRTGASDLAPQKPVEIFGETSVRLLYEKNANEIFVNSNKVEMYADFPELFDPGPLPKVVKVKLTDDSDCKIKCCKACC